MAAPPITVDQHLVHLLQFYSLCKRILFIEHNTSTWANNIDYNICRYYLASTVATIWFLNSNLNVESVALALFSALWDLNPDLHMKVS